MEKRKAELIHSFGKDEAIVETLMVGTNQDIIIILTTKGVYKLNLTSTGTATVRAIKP